MLHTQHVEPQWNSCVRGTSLVSHTCTLCTKLMLCKVCKCLVYFWLTFGTNDIEHIDHHLHALKSPMMIVENLSRIVRYVTKICSLSMLSHYLFLFFWYKKKVIVQRSLNHKIECSVAEWLRQWVNLGVTPPLSDWEVVGSNPTGGMSRIGFLIQGRNFDGFPWTKMFHISFSIQQDHLAAMLFL